jgi:hypothetical protein
MNKRQAISKMLLAEISAQLAAYRAAFANAEFVDDLYRSLGAQLRIGLIA